MNILKYKNILINLIQNFYKFKIDLNNKNSSKETFQKEITF